MTSSHRSDSGGQPCTLTDFCKNLMTQPGCPGYCLSHQMLFFLWARMVSAPGCGGGTTGRGLPASTTAFREKEWVVKGEFPKTVAVWHAGWSQIRTQGLLLGVPEGKTRKGRAHSLSVPPLLPTTFPNPIITMFYNLYFFV